MTPEIDGPGIACEAGPDGDVRLLIIIPGNDTIVMAYNQAAAIGLGQHIISLARQHRAAPVDPRLTPDRLAAASRN